MEALSAPSSLISHHPCQLQPGQQSQNRFKLMLVHDGYQFFDQAVQDLKNSGFPADSEVLLLSVSDLFRTPLHLVGKISVPPAQGCATRAHSLPRYRKTKAFFDKLESVKLKAHAKLQAVFPLWDISFERPLSWEPDLIYLGAFNPSSATDAGLGEIIRKLTAESSVPLRVARPQSEASATDRPTIVAIDGPASAAAALRALAGPRSIGGMVSSA